MAFGTEYIMTFADYASAVWTVEFQIEGGSAGTAVTAGADPLSIRWNCSEKYQPIVGSSADIQIVWDANADEIYTETSQSVKVLIKKATVLKWTGWLVPGMYHRQFNQPKHYITVTAADGLGELHGCKFEDGSGDPYFGQETEMTAITDILQKTGHQFNLYEGINIYEDDMDETTADSPLVQTYFYPEKYWDEKTDERGDCYNVLSDILTKYGARVFQWDSYWMILRPNSAIRPSIVVRKYNYAGVYDDVYSIVAHVTTTAKSMSYLNADAEITRLNAIGRCEVTVDPPRRENLFKNGSFDAHTWSGTAFAYWEATGGSSGGPDYTCENGMLKMSNGDRQITNPPTYYISTVIKVPKCTTLRISFDAVPYYTGDPSTATIYGMLKCGTKYLGTAWGSNPDTFFCYIDTQDLTYPIASETAVKFSMEIPSMGGDIYYMTANPEFEIRFYEFRNETAQGTPWDNYYTIDNLRLEAEYSTGDTQIFTFENTNTVNNSEALTINGGDAPSASTYGDTASDTYFPLTTAADRASATDAWFIKGDAETEATPIPIGHILAKQRVEGFWRPIDVLRATFKGGTGYYLFNGLQDPNITDYIGFPKVFYPNGIQMDCRIVGWSGEWIECPAIYTDLSLDWASETYGGVGIISGNEIDIDETVSGTMTATSDAFAVVDKELIRFVVTVTLVAGELPNYSCGGNTGTLANGVNYLELVMDADDATETFQINHTNGEVANCVVVIYGYRMSGL